MTTHDGPAPIAPRLDPPPDEVTRLVHDLGCDVITRIARGVLLGEEIAAVAGDRAALERALVSDSKVFRAAALAAYDEACGR